MSVDLGLYPPQADEESSDDEDMYTENVWWETADNLAFVSDEGPPITPVDQVQMDRNLEIEMKGDFFFWF